MRRQKTLEALLIESLEAHMRMQQQAQAILKQANVLKQANEVATARKVEYQNQTHKPTKRKSV